MTSAVGFILVTLGVLVGVVVAAAVVMYLIVPLFKAIGWVFARIFGFIGGEIADVARLIGSLITTLVFVPIILGTVVVGRWSASAHFGRAMQRETATIGGCLYRIFLGHPARLFGLTPLTEGFEHRIPEVVRAAPGADKPSGRTAQFEGYKILGSLMGGGSGAKLYIAEPDAIKRATFERQGFGNVGRVVIKSFSIRDGSTLPQIVRESRALDAARRLGFVLDHDLTAERFFYITRYVPGESLGLVTQQLHASSGAGLSGKELSKGMKYVADLLATLDSYHRGGLWHKDVKPDNIIVHDDTAHLVDLGLVTPLRSAMTLTTHGTEYFRDPEMVRMALKGAKVHQVDGARFDVFAVGAVLYSVIENSFPAHGGLSQITKRCPEALRWIVRRAMADYDKRYATAADMLADLAAVRAAADPFSLRPADLPSVRGGDSHEPELPHHDAAPFVDAARVAHAGAAVPPRDDAGAARGPDVRVPAGERLRQRPRLLITNWWRGSYRVAGEDSVVAKASGASGASARAAAAAAMANAADAMNRAAERFGSPRQGPVPAGSPAPDRGDAPAARQAVRNERVRAIPDPARRSAQEQLRAARDRAAAARERAHARMSGRHRRATRTDGVSGVNAGVVAAVFGFIGIAVLLGGGVVGYSLMSTRSGAESGPRVVVADPGPGLILVPDAAQVSGTSAQGVSAVNAVARPNEIVNARIAEAMQTASTRIVEMQEMFREASELASAAAQSPGGSVLIVTDVLPPMSRGARAAIEGASARMMAFGFRLLGNVPGIDVEGDEVDRQNDLLARLRAMRGQIPLGSADATRTIQQFLASNPEAGDAVVWVAPGDDRDEPTFYLVVRGDESGSTVRAERIRQALRTAIEHRGSQF
ncbi:MAG: hypothetical protein KF912_04005 [Phycisphaeraceae bacterium]|nr:hypothetical protein [Phycisphaeraceae bacterium]